MDYKCEGCNAKLTPDELREQTVAVPHCHSHHHKGPFAPVQNWQVQTRPEVQNLRTAVEE